MNTRIRYSFTAHDNTTTLKDAVVRGAITSEQMGRISKVLCGGRKFTPSAVGLPDGGITNPDGSASSFSLSETCAWELTPDEATVDMDTEELALLFERGRFVPLFHSKAEKNRANCFITLAEIRLDKNREVLDDGYSRDYKIKQLTQMLRHEMAENEEHYGAKLSHHAGDANTIDISAGALLALIKYYENDVVTQQDENGAGPVRVPQEEKKAEAAARLELLGVPSSMVDSLLDKNSYISESTPPTYATCWLNESEFEKIREFEKENNAFVYHVISDTTDAGKVETYLYVSDRADEWAKDRSAMERGQTMAYVQNLPHPELSGVRRVGITTSIGGGLRRIF